MTLDGAAETARPARAFGRWRTAWLVAIGAVVGIELGTAAARAQSSASLGGDALFGGKRLVLDRETLILTHEFASTPFVQLQIDDLGVFGQASDWFLPQMARVDLATPVNDRARLEALAHDLSVANGFTFASPRFVDEHGRGVVIGKELLVAFEPWVGDVLARSLLARYGDVLERDVAGMPDVYRVSAELRSGFDVLAAAAILNALPETRWCEPDAQLEIERHHVPNDPLFPSQWALANTGQSGGVAGMDMRASQAWNTTFGDASIVVGVLDDGVDQSHPDLAQIPGVDFTGGGGGGGPLSICDNHGTAVAGCISAGIDNGLGTCGVAPNARVQSLKVVATGSTCNGQGVFHTSWFLNALEHCEQSGVRITNTSLGFASVTAIAEKFASTRAAGVVHFASAGNTGGAIGHPADLPHVLAVGAIAATGVRATFSSQGDVLALVAPGQSIWTTDRLDGAGYSSSDYVVVNGTSFAAPHAAGVAALVLSVDSTLTPTEVEGILATTAFDLGAVGRDDAYGHGLVRADAAVAAAANQSGPPQIASASPSSVRVLAIGETGRIVVTGTGLAQTTGARLGGVTLDSADVIVVDDGRVELSYTRLARLGSIDVELLHAGGSRTTSVSVTPVATPTLEVSETTSGGLDRALGLEIFVASQPDDVYYLIGSLIGTPTEVPGVITAGIGGGSLANIHLLAIGVVDPFEGVNRHVYGLGGLPIGLAIHVQAGVLDGQLLSLPLATTNVRSATIVE